MYGLPSRESLSRRQSRWVREVDETVRSNPSHKALTQNSSPDPLRTKSNIISLMNTPILDPQNNTKKSFDNHFMNIIPDDNVHSQYEELNTRYTKLMARLTKLEQNEMEFQANLQKLSTVTERVDGLEHSTNTYASRLEALEHSVSELSTLSEKESPPIEENSSEFSAMSCLTFIPFFIKESYAARDNMTKLEGVHLNMIVEILGFYQETPIIFPFGKETKLPKFTESKLQMSFKDSAEAIDGSAYGTFKRGSDGIYTIHITELFSDGNASGIEHYTLPLIISCKCDLILE